MFKKIFIGYFIGVLSVLFSIFPPAADAFVLRNGNDAVIPKGETVNGTLVIAGQTVTVDGEVKGDVICAGQTIIINGTVDGDVICAGQNITVSNSVSGSVRAAGQVVNIGGKVGRNATVVGQTVKNDSEMQGEMLFAAQSAAIGGVVAKGVAGAADSITVSGNIGGDAQFKNSTLILKNNAVIAGALGYESANEAVMESGSRVAGGARRFEPPASEKNPEVPKKEETIQQKILDKGTGLFIYLIVALLFVTFFKGAARKTVDSMLVKPGRSISIGLLILVLVPIASIAFAITVIGIPIALSAALLFVVALFFSRIFAAIAIGRKFTKMYYKSKQDSLLVQALIGIVSLWILFAIPVIGSILSLASVIWGLGGIYYMFKKEKLNPAL